MSQAAATKVVSSSPTGDRDTAAKPRAAAQFEFSDTLGLAAVLTLGGTLLLFRLHTGWFPHDEGVLGQSAERVLLGQVPHRDFDEIYTGLLTYIHALSFKLFGITLPSLRIPLFVGAMLWLVAVYRLVIRFAPPLGAALVALLVLTWSVPNYPASMPSWYNLFCATWGLLALVRWTEDGRLRWLLLAGAAGGISFLFKLTGIFYIAGGLMAIAALTATHREAEPSSADLRVASLVVSLAFASMAGAVMLLMLNAGSTEIARFALPIGVLAAAFIAREWTRAGGNGRQRLEDLLNAVVPFTLGAVLPIAIFLGWFAAQGAIANLLDGVFLTPFRRVGFARVPPPPPMLIWLIPLAWLLWPRRQPTDRRWLRGAAIVAAPMLLLLLLSETTPAVYRSVWQAAWALPMLACIVGAVAAARGVPFLDTVAERDRRTLICTAVIAVFVLLVEYPFAAPIYTLYALPIAMIAVTIAVRMTRLTPPPLQWAVLLFFLVFGALRVEPTGVPFLAAGYMPRADSALLEMPRGRLWVPPQHAWEYETVVSLIQQHAADRPLWAGPDSPEIYYLSGAQNHTRTMFDFFDAEPGSALRSIQQIGAGMVVINMHPGFSPRLSEDDLARIAVAFPHSRSVGRFFVLWR